MTLLTVLTPANLVNEVNEVNEVRIAGRPMNYYGWASIIQPRESTHRPRQGRSPRAGERLQPAAHLRLVAPVGIAKQRRHLCLFGPDEEPIEHEPSAGTMIQGDSVPSRPAIPDRISRNPRHMGLRVKR